MFSRAAGLSPVCLRCQLRLAGRNRPGVFHDITEFNRSARRWQGAVAVRSVNDQDEPESSPPQNQEPSHAKDESHIKENRGQVITGDNEKLKRTKGYKRWRPHKSEELGLDVLGKPAEVLILPTRKRKTAQPVIESNGDKEKGVLQKSLDSELKPISMNDVMKNIDSFKTDLGKDRQAFPETEWRDLRKRLSDGFTKLQMQEYLRIRLGMTESDHKQGYLLPSKEKQDIAAKIMMDVWKWKRKSQDDKGSAPQSTPKHVKMSINVSAAKLGFIMLHEKQQLGNLSEALNVQIDVFKKKSRIEIRGTSASIKDANAQLRQFVKDLRESTLQIPRYLQEALDKTNKSRSLLAALSQKHKLLIQRDQDVLTIIGHSQTDVDVVLRDLILLTSLSDATPFSSYTDSALELTTRVPFYPDDLPYHLQQDSHWYRQIAPSTSTEDAEELVMVRNREVRRLTGNLLKSERPNHDMLSRLEVVPGSVKQEYIADLGQALFNSTESVKSASSLPIQQKASAPLFVLHQALLPQMLAKKDFEALQNTKDVETGSDEGHTKPFLLHLRLRPVAQSPRHPPFEMFLKGRDARLGLNQQFEIRKVVAVLDQWQHILLLPHQPVDIRVTRRTTIDLLGNGANKPSKAYLNVLHQIGSYLEQARLADRLQLPPIWRLDISSMLKEKTTSSPPEYEKAMSLSSNQEKTPETESAPPEVSSNQDVTAVYALEPPEYLDIKSYTSLTSYDRYIDHVICDTDSVDFPKQRQLLQVRGKSLSDLLVDSPRKDAPVPTNSADHKKWFKTSITVAHDLATALKEAGNIRRQAVTVPVV